MGMGESLTTLPAPSIVAAQNYNYMHAHLEIHSVSKG